RGDLAVADAAGHQPQDLQLTLRQRLQKVEGISAPGLFDAVTREVRHQRCVEIGPTAGDCAYSFQKGLRRHAFEQISPGACLDPLNQGDVVFEGRQQQSRWQALLTGELLDDFHPGEPGHANVQEKDIRVGGQGCSDGCFTIDRLRDNFYSAQKPQESLQAAAHERLIIREAHANQDMLSARGSMPLTRKPAPSVLLMARLPPRVSKRSRMPSNPLPGVNRPPRPSSRAVIVSPPPSLRSSIMSSRARAWRVVLVMTS